MNNEITGLLEYIKNINDNEIIYITKRESNLLLDCITNLQEEKEKLNNAFDELEKWCDDCIVGHQIARDNGEYTISDTFFEIVKNKLNELRNK